MPFEVFRRHQRKMLAILAILAMFTFVLADSLPRMLSSSYGNRGDAEVAKVFGKTVRLSDLHAMASERNRANLLMASVSQRFDREGFFGGLKQRDLIDAVILEKEADRLGMPADPAAGKAFLQANSMLPLNRENFEVLYSRFSNEVSREQLLSDLANQARIQQVRGLIGGRPMITPYDVYQAYRNQGERVADKIVEIPVENFLAKVEEPSSTEVQTLFDKYKDVLPSPSSPTPGFKVPRKVQVEFVSIDAEGKARALRDKLPEAELQTFYENHKNEYKIPSDFPDDLFADAPELTPPVIQPFAQVKALLAERLADEKAQEEVGNVFGEIRDKNLIPFADEYLTMLDDKAADPTAKVKTPADVDLKSIAAKDGLAYEISPLLSREQAERYGMIANAQVGSARLTGGRRFVDEFFDPKVGLYEPVELIDLIGNRYLARKMKDEAPRVPKLDEVRADVVRAWKLEKARPLAEKAAQDIASKLKAEKKGKIEADQVDGYTVASVPPITSMQTGFADNPFGYAPPTETPIPGIAYPAEALRNAYFSVQEGEPLVASNQPGTMYYVVALDRREPVDFNNLYGPVGEEMSYKALTRVQTMIRQNQDWMDRLRREAGLPADWAPPDEASKDEEARG